MAERGLTPRAHRILAGLPDRATVVPANKKPETGEPLMKRIILALAVCGGLFVPSNALAATVYEDYSSVGSVNRTYGDRYDVKADYSRIGYVKRSYGERWDAYEGYRKVGYVKRSYGGRFDIYSGYRKVGFVKRSYGGRFDIYEGYRKVGYVNGGTGGPAGGAALLLLLG